MTVPNKKVECALRFRIQGSNNETKYEVLLAGLQLATSIVAQQVWAFNDCQLVVNQILQLYEAREDNMMAYLAFVSQVIEN